MDHRPHPPTATLLALTLTLVPAGFAPAAAPEVERVERVERGNLVIEGIPEIPESVAERIQQYENTRSASLGGWHPAGDGVLISTRFGETNQVHWVREPGGARRQLTFFDEPVGGAEPSPNPTVGGFLFSKDVGGSENFQIHYFDLADGKYRMLTDGTSRNGGAQWSNDGKRYAYFTTRRNGRDWDIYVGEVAKPGSDRAVLEPEGTWGVADWSPDDSRLLVARYVSANESYPHVLDLASGELTEINPSDDKIAYGAATFSADGKGVYYTSDEGSEFHRLRYYDLASGESKVLSGDIPWDVESVELAPDGKRLAFTVNEGGVARLHLRDTATMSELPLPELPVGQIFSIEFSPDGKRLGMTLISSQTPGDVYSIDLATGALTQWTFSEAGGLDTSKFVTPEVVEFQTFDQDDGAPRMIPAFYYRPPGEGPFPVVVNIHGGPEGQARPFFNPVTQYYVLEMGVAVLFPNVRGSSGYGKSYLLLDNAEKREDSVRDIGALLDWIGTRPELDADRIAVVGGSYGGYMVLASMVHFDDRLRAGIDLVGISNFVTFLENTSDYRRDLRRVEYGDEREPEMRAVLERISPNNHAAKISKPLFVVQGLNDPRVPASESEQMVDVIREHGGTVWYLLAKDEGHGFNKKANRDYFTHAAVLFLERFLIGEGGGGGGEAPAGPAAE